MCPMNASRVEITSMHLFPDWRWGDRAIACSSGRNHLWMIGIQILSVSQIWNPTPCSLVGFSLMYGFRSSARTRTSTTTSTSTTTPTSPPPPPHHLPSSLPLTPLATPLFADSSTIIPLVLSSVFFCSLLSFSLSSPLSSAKKILMADGAGGL